MLLDYPNPWDTGAPLPHVISDGFKTFSINYIGEHNDITALVDFIN